MAHDSAYPDLTTSVCRDAGWDRSPRPSNRPATQGLLVPVVPAVAHNVTKDGNLSAELHPNLEVAPGDTSTSKACLEVEQYSAVPGTVVRRLQGHLFEQAVGMCKETSVPGMSWPFSWPYVAEQVELLANRPETMINSKAMHDLG
jgi:hypothetical protein